MNEFTASNGITVANHGGNWDVTTIHFTGEVLGLAKNRTHERDMAFEDRDLLALREFFQAEADERLGRWRWPENPDYVVYPTANSNAVEVSNQRGGVSGLLHRDGSQIDGTRVGTVFHEAAAAYFDAHPDPKPWHDAQPGEIWALGIGGGYHGDSITVVEVDGEPRFIWHVGGENGLRNIPVRDRSIDYGRRVWPVVAS